MTSFFAAVRRWISVGSGGALAVHRCPFHSHLWAGVEENLNIEIHPVPGVNIDIRSHVM